MCQHHFMVMFIIALSTFTRVTMSAKNICNYRRGSAYREDLIE